MHYGPTVLRSGSRAAALFAGPVAKGARAPVGGFTLVELLVVLGIIALVLAVALPSFRAMNEGKSMEGAARQLLSDLQFARQSAIATRSTVAVVFVPPEIVDPGFLSPYSGADRTNVVQLQGSALTGYALLSFRQVGEQPGRNTLRYLTPWRALPERVFIAEDMFDYGTEGGFWTNDFPFPTSRSSTQVRFPYVAFNSQGQCVPITNKVNGATMMALGDDMIIRLASGSIMYTRDPSGEVVSWNVQEIPPDNSNVSSNVVRINLLTGRAKLERADVTRQ